MYKNKRVFLTYRILLIIWGATLLTGVVFQWLYIESSSKIINTSQIQNIIAQKENSANKNIQRISNLLIEGREDSLRLLASKPLGAIFYVYKNNKLIFWNNNEVSTPDIDSQEWTYHTSPNAYLLSKSYHINNYRITSYILIKYNFPYENNELSNDFEPEFGLSKKIKIIEGNTSDKYAIHDRNSKSSNYLFTLQLPENEKLHNEKWGKIALILFTLVFLLTFYLYGHFPFLLKRTILSSARFFAISLGTLAIVVVCAIFNIPSTFFQNDIFTSFHYASNPLLATLTHLSFFTLYIFSTIYLYTYFVKRSISKKFRYIKTTFLILLPAAYFILMFNVMVGMVFNSSTDLNVLSVGNLTITTVWNHFLLLIWGIGYVLLFVKTHKTTQQKNGLKKIIIIDAFLLIIIIPLLLVLFKKYSSEAIISYIFLTLVLYLPILHKDFLHSKWYFAIFFVFFALFVVDNSVRMNSDKKLSQYRLLAENLYFNESSQEEKITESMFSDLDKELNKDGIFKRMATYPDSVIVTNNYLNNKYLRGYWARFEMKLISAYKNTDVDKSYQEMINSSGCILDGTHFYKIEKSFTGMSYLGVYATGNSESDKVNVYLEFYPRSSYKSYSYPDLLIQSPPSIQSKLSLSIAKYSPAGNIVYSSGKFKYPRSAKWIDDPKKDFFVQDYAGARHYIYVPSLYNYMVVTESIIPNTLSYFLYYLYTYVAFLLLCLLLFWMFNIFNKKEIIIYNLTTKLLISFISLMVICFVAIFYVSYDYTQRKYKEKQLEDIGLKRNYIQNTLQEKYYWNQKLDSTLTTKLNLDLQDLSYTYQTDINVYDNDGCLIGTSQSAIFSKNLISKLISPKPFFSKNSNLDQYEHIGKLEYLATYTDFYNGEFLPIGYISIPQFLSKNEYNADVQSFLVVIAHISLIIIILFIIISIVIGRRLTSPLTTIENRLKDIRLGKENKKIDYKGNDEIGQLVAQYNRTVDELEKSAQLLATSERESAWKLMARQVAHEINNPLTPMKLTIQQLQRSKAMNDARFDSYFDKSATTLIEQIENLSQIAGTFSTFARLPEPVIEKVDVAKRISSVVQLFANNNENVEVSYTGTNEGIYSHTDKKQLIQVFNNLLKNALQSIPSSKKGIIEVTLKHSETTIWIEFKDNGNGVPAEIKDKLFVPNFTTKSTGMGLGLAISRNIIRSSGGDVTFESEKGKGTVFQVRLPRTSD